jgi:signal peptidase I
LETARGALADTPFRVEYFEGTLKADHPANQIGKMAANSARKLLVQNFKTQVNRHGNASLELACGLAEEVVRNFGEVRLRVFGTSMVPSVLPGDLVLVHRANMEEISTSEIVLFLQMGRLFVHRVVDRKIMAAADGHEESFLITRGDRQRDHDAPVSSSELLGRVVSIERDHRKIELVPNKVNRFVARLLQTSDRVTSLYLLLATFSRTIFLRRAKCQV